MTLRGEQSVYHGLAARALLLLLGRRQTGPEAQSVVEAPAPRDVNRQFGARSRGAPGRAVDSVHVFTKDDPGGVENLRTQLGVGLGRVRQFFKSFVATAGAQ